MRAVAVFAATATVLGVRAWSPPSSGDLAVLYSRLINSYVLTVNVTGADEDVTSYLPLITAPGVFADLNYTAQPATGWGGYDHCLRMAEMASALASPTSRYYNSATVRSALLGPTGVFSWFLLAQPQDLGNWVR